MNKIPREVTTMGIRVSGAANTSNIPIMSRKTEATEILLRVMVERKYLKRPGLRRTMNPIAKKRSPINDVI